MSPVVVGVVEKGTPPEHSRTVAELTDAELLEIFPGAQFDRPGRVELDPEIWRPCDPGCELASGKFNGGPLDGARHRVPEHGPALVRTAVEGAVHFYAHKTGTARTYSYVGEAS